MTAPVPSPEPTPGDPAPEPPAAPTPEPPADEPLGPAGKRALDAERARVKELERQMSALAPLQQLAAAMAGDRQEPGGPSEVELLQQRFAELERTANEERAARWRVEISQQHNLTPEQAAWISGSTREELEQSAAKLLAAFPPAPAGPRIPAPDPSQGARGPVDIDQQIIDAERKGDVRTSILLKAHKAQNARRN